MSAGNGDGIVETLPGEGLGGLGEQTELLFVLAFAESSLALVKTFIELLVFGVLFGKDGDCAGVGAVSDVNKLVCALVIVRPVYALELLHSEDLEGDKCEPVQDDDAEIAPELAFRVLEPSSNICITCKNKIRQRL
jgi:hypothetical protein